MRIAEPHPQNFGFVGEVGWGLRICTSQVLLVLLVYGQHFENHLTNMALAFRGLSVAAVYRGSTIQ